ncbi:hypothetical protein MMC09_004821 [Bachmanniomyces sp. S44760]|nr:hypothetical protein [Bachmanniomyces sp. S44760]
MSSTKAQLELLKRQYLQLIEPDQLTLPGRNATRKLDVQQGMYSTMFTNGCLQYQPPVRYKVRVLKRIVETIEHAIVDPEEDEISDDLTYCLADLMSQPQIPYDLAAQRKCYVTYTMPSLDCSGLGVTTLEARSLLAASGTTGLRTWEAALSLGTYLSSSSGKHFVKGKNVIEVGAGTGFLSILCAKYLDARYVLATDGSVGTVSDLTSNIHLNGLQVGDGIGVAVLEWGHTLPDGPNNGYTDARRYDLLLGADVTYDGKSIPSLLATFKNLFSKHPAIVALISATVRNEETLEVFTKACSKYQTKNPKQISTIDKY